MMMMIEVTMMKMMMGQQMAKKSNDNDVKVEEFGCIPHETIPFLAASPDGIVTSNKLNGRMIEIKNVVSRNQL